MHFLSAALFTSLPVCPFVSGQKVATSLFLFCQLYRRIGQLHTSVVPLAPPDTNRSTDMVRGFRRFS